DAARVYDTGDQVRIGTVFVAISRVVIRAASGAVHHSRHVGHVAGGVVTIFHHGRAVAGNRDGISNLGDATGAIANERDLLAAAMSDAAAAVAQRIIIPVDALRQFDIRIEFV